MTAIAPEHVALAERTYDEGRLRQRQALEAGITISEPRQRCHALVDAVPEEELDEVEETLSEMVAFYLAPREPVTRAEPKPVTVRIVGHETRPLFHLEPGDE